MLHCLPLAGRPFSMTIGGINKKGHVYASPSFIGQRQAFDLHIFFTFHILRLTFHVLVFTLHRFEAGFDNSFVIYGRTAA